MEKKTAPKCADNYIPHQTLQTIDGAAKMNTPFVVLAFSTPASPRKDVKMTPCFRVAHYAESYEEAERLMALSPRSQTMVVPTADLRKYL